MDVKSRFDALDFDSSGSIKLQDFMVDPFFRQMSRQLGSMLDNMEINRGIFLFLSFSFFFLFLSFTST